MSYEYYWCINKLAACYKLSVRHTRGHLRVAISTVSDPSGSGRVDMLTGPVAAARAAVATGAWVTSKHDSRCCCCNGSVGYIETRHVSDTWRCGSLSCIFTHPPED